LRGFTLGQNGHFELPARWCLFLVFTLGQNGRRKIACQFATFFEQNFLNERVRYLFLFFFFQKFILKKVANWQAKTAQRSDLRF
jgi:hypothetical protein